jgi:hypothetical protein
MLGGHDAVGRTGGHHRDGVGPTHLTERGLDGPHEITGSAAWASTSVSVSDRNRWPPATSRCFSSA